MPPAPPIPLKGEVTVVVFDDGEKKRVFMAEKIFRKKIGKHNFTSLSSYDDLHAYRYKEVEGEQLREKIKRLSIRAFNALHHKDYAKFDVRVEDSTNTPYFTDSNPNTAFGPDLGLPMTEVMQMHGVEFEDTLAALLSNYAKSIS